jgi:solute carrier family 25 protein 38
VSKDGAKGLWRGTVPTILRNVPGSALYFAFLNESKSFFGNYLKGDAVNLVAGGMSRMLAGLVLMPATVVKVRYEVRIPL